ncbi:MAG: DegT/DnrJ/EryC1/StrS aminotransferase family protein [Bacteroidetes bacterium]|nr:DegT/DnrJ/EryC1/StrS aminotransferase family protein [Bacteroidota bacterium]
MAIPFIDLGAQQARIKDKLDTRIQSVLADGKYIMGPEVKELEQGLADFCNAKYVISCANGTDALLLALMALKATNGDAIFCPSFTFAATAEMVPFCNATPFFVDVLPNTYNLDPESLKRCITHARTLGLNPAGIISVDLFGLPADYDQIETIAAENNLWIIGDSAQGFGAVHKGRFTGSIGDIATTSFFPAKPLGCYGDGGAVFTSDEYLYSKLISYRIHGKGVHKYDNECIGMNSRLDTLQAAILLEKLAIYREELEQRQVVASRYNNGLANILQVPHVPDGLKSVWAQYTVQAKSQEERDGFMGALKEQGIPSVVYYPSPLHKQTAYKKFPSDPNGLAVSKELATKVFSLPMHPYLTEEVQKSIISELRHYAVS